jgi:uroporphyrinogen decarboxylase
MDPLTRFKRTFSFQTVDRAPLRTQGGWPETIDRWRQEGLPEDWRETNYFGEDRIGGTGVHLGTCRFSPFFPRMERKILEETEAYVIFRDEHGRVVKIKKGREYASLSQYLEFPVKTRADWEAIRWRMDPGVEERYTRLEAVARLHGGTDERDYPVQQGLSGTYRMLWHLFGDIQMGYALHDDPDLVQEIMETWLQMNIGAIDRVMRHVDVNLIMFLEDMCYRGGMLLSPRMFREFMMPYYKALIAHVREYPSVFGVWVDTDGDITDLTPLLVECGVQGLTPFEVQAGLDVVQIRETYSDLVIRGGIDKREIAKGKEATDRELARVLPTFVETGGYVICLDHSAPPDISLENYLYFIDQAKSYWS